MRPPGSGSQRVAEPLPAVPQPGQTALVVGLGRSGVALARYLSEHGVIPRVADLRPKAQLREYIEALPVTAQLQLGGYTKQVLHGCAAVYASPGVPWDSDLLQLARERRIPVSSEMDLFFRLCPAPIVGVTGTNGKTTTTALVGQVLQAGERPVLVGGNIGDTVLDRLDEITPWHWVVLELSSFQLESIERPRPHISVVLNVTPDHLDRHHDLDSYIDAKARIVEYQQPQDHAVLNGRDPVCRKLAERTHAQVVWFDEHEPAPPMPVPGRHNLENARAAAAVGRIAGLDDGAINAAVSRFSGVEHRLEFVGEWGGVRWYNDSKATNPEAGRVALQSFPGQPIVLIAGGYGGGFDLDAWVDDIKAHCRGVVLIGASASEVGKRLAGHVPFRRADSLENAIEIAAAMARPGSVVLLSPGYKSFDMFRDFEDRGRQFKVLVLKRHRR
jgi:UDP-N-acetylmuramoylalanine--D-glutamate ligase